MAEEDKGAIAFQLVMALCSDLAEHEPHRLRAMRNRLQGLLRSEEIVRHEDRQELRTADDVLRRLLE